MGLATKIAQKLVVGIFVLIVTLAFLAFFALAYPIFLVEEWCRA